jgi:hypothetical protein
VKPPKQTEIQSSVEGGLTSIVKILLRDFGLFIALPLAILITMLTVIPFPLGYVIVYSLLIFIGIIIVIFAVPVIRHFDELLLRMKRGISRMAPEYFGAEEGRLLDILSLRFLGLGYGIWMFRIIGAIIAGFFAYQLYVLLAESL